MKVVDVVSERRNPMSLIIRATTSLTVILVDIAQKYARSHRHSQLGGRKQAEYDLQAATERGHQLMIGKMKPSPNVNDTVSDDVEVEMQFVSKF